eukprot:scaffold8136_cov127-Cylindrotheca_fusiformis.AAC.16
MAKAKSSTSPKRESSSTEGEGSRPKRARKTGGGPAAVYDPVDFTMKEPEGIKIIKGRGSKLGSFPSVKASIESSKRTADEISFAHQFLFGKKGKPTKREMKDHLLEFSGYLKPIPSGKSRTDKEVEKEEELVEVRGCIIDENLRSHQRPKI